MNLPYRPSRARDGRSSVEPEVWAGRTGLSEGRAAVSVRVSQVQVE
jgi:hypothetical protein